MIIGLGTDIAEVLRIKKIVKNTSFCTRFFTDAENRYFESKQYNAETIAGNFAAKEALSKALGTGIRGFSLRDIEVLRDTLGKPYINVYKAAKQKIETLNAEIYVSISHTQEYATAVVVLERK